MAIPQDVIDTVKERVNLSEIIAEYVELKRSGRHFVGRCPFHTEKTPSFFVRDEEGSFHCFGCGKRGSVFNFVMEMKGLSFPDAVRLLAGRVGVDVPEDGRSRDQTTSRNARLKLLREILRIAAETYAEELNRNKLAKAYLESRGVTPTSIEAFGLGYAPQAWTFLEPRIRERLGERSELSGEVLTESLIEVGLIKRRSAEHTPRAGESNCFDVLRERIIFPIRNTDGSVIAFGGRTLQRDPSVPKYLNTCESPLYVKRRSLYGLDRAIGEVRKSREVLVVEGYLDVLSMVQGGFENTVATCGTALTQQHGESLRRVADRVIIAFDGDRAGRKAGAQAFETFLNSGLDVSVALFPDDLDPDSAVRERGPACVREVLQAAAPAVEVYLEWHRTEEAAGGELSPAVLGRVGERFARAVSAVTNPVEREFLLKRGAALLGVSVDALDALLRSATARSSGARPPSGRGPVREAVSATAAEASPEFIAAPVAADSELHRPLQRTVRERESGGAAAKGRGAAPRRSAVQRTRGGLLRQVVIAALCEPPCAQAFLIIPRLLPETAPQESLVGRIRLLLQELSHFEGRGLGEVVAVEAADPSEHDAEGRTLTEVTAKLQSILQRFELGSHGLLENALRQLQVGGWRAGDLLEDCRWAAEHLDLRTELEQLRVEISEEPDEGAKLRMAQEKLLKRRKLEEARRDATKAS